MLSYATIITSPSCATFHEYYDQVCLATNYGGEGDPFYQISLIYGNARSADIYYTGLVMSIAFGFLVSSWFLWTLDLIDFGDFGTSLFPLLASSALLVEGLLIFKEIWIGLILMTLGLLGLLLVCFFALAPPRCKIRCSEEEEKRIIKKDDDVQINLFLGDRPYAFGHIVVQPKNCEDDISKLTEKHWKILSKWVPKVAIAMRKVLKEVSGRDVKRIYLCSFNESTDYPVHFHLVPRYECETLRGDDLLFHRAQEKSTISLQERDKIVNAMKKELESLSEMEPAGDKKVQNKILD